MRYYRSHQRTVLRTDEDGTVIVTVDWEGDYTLETTGPVDRGP
jgi:beta-lactamase superfamily II metal-dependent hydrolase